MKLIFNTSRNRFESICTYDEKHIPKKAGCTWDGVAWHTGSPTAALKLKEYADVAALHKIEELMKEESKLMAASFATDSTLDIPVPAGLSYLPYQRAGIEFASLRQNCLIADSMGLGKTVQVLGLINLSVATRRVLIIAPAGLRLNWTKEAAKWLVRATPIHRSGKKGIPDFEDGLLIMGYEEATKHALALGKQSWDLIVCDEAHYLKNPKAKRTKAILTIPAARYVLLTGTPILNRPIELFPLLQKIDPSGLGLNWMSFAKRYCDAYHDGWGWRADGASNLEELNLKLRTGGMIRREKSQVLKELPNKRHALIPLEPNTAAKKLLKEEKEKALEKAKTLRKIKALERASDEKFAEDIKKLKGIVHQIEFTDMARIRHQLALVKVDQVVEHVVLSAQSGPIVVFAHHRDVISKIETALQDEGFKVATIVGGLDERVKEAAKEAFQEGKLDVIVCGIKAAAEGLTLTRSSHVIFAEVDWTPGRMQQAEDRCHRIGQKDSVLVDWLVLDDSLDAKMVKTLLAKTKVTSKATGAGMTEADVAQEATIISEEDFAKARAREEIAKKLEVMNLHAQKTLDEKFGHIYGNFGVVDEEGKISAVWVRKDQTGHLGIHRSKDAANSLKMIRAIASDLEKAQMLYGRATGKCSICRRELKDPISKYLGIGPECGSAIHARYRAHWLVALDFADLLEAA